MSTHHADAARMLDDRGYSGHLIRGQAPHLLIEEAVRNRITSSLYWKEQCYALNAATLCDRAVELTYIGGTYNSGLRATPFMCLLFKMLQLDLEREVLDVYLQEGGEEWKYLRALAAFYIRLTESRSEGVYSRLEGYLEDKRKLRTRGNGGFGLTYVDEFIDRLLSKDRVCATSLWKLVPREQLEEDGELDERVSSLQHMLESEDEREDAQSDDHGQDERDGDSRSQEGSDRSNKSDSQQMPNGVGSNGINTNALEEPEVP